ncbi:Peptide methionine sulfoxide reductase MsrB [Tenacibaculum sp. 190524A02b]|uniref:peptide-methionine (R)-S-oxide reductase n=1 Tax=Tenacibaculum vairaonense TaxID=3137860 RepID=A0ABP1FAU9_9FLAO
MKKYILAFLLIIVSSHFINAQTTKEYKVSKTNKEWKRILTSKQYFILRQAGTERPFSSSYNKNYKKGVYHCAGCNTPLYKSEHKYDSGSGWPSFDRAIKGNIKLDVDYKIGYARNELKCNTCGGHLGHVFDDGPVKTTGKRHCINGAALKFIRKKS